jgi:hypothetical protein
MLQIADWLEKLGMSEYARRFAENDIDCSVLPYLTDQDLKELGVSLGHRRKMLASISELGGALQATPEAGARAERTAGRIRRTPPGHGSVLRSGWLYGVGRQRRP